MEYLPPSTQTVNEHIVELCKRLILCALSVFIWTVVGWIFNQKILEFLTRPLDQPLYYTSPTGGFEIVFKSSFLFGVLMSTPILAYQLIRFIEPALSKKSEKFILFFSFTSVVLMLSGVSFAYFVSFPAALTFLNKFNSEEIKSLISTKDYFSFITIYIGGFGILFQLPLLILSANWIQPIKIKKLLRFFPYIILISFIIAAILTPTPDPFNQSIMATPVVVLYILSIVPVWLINRKRS